jgi:TIR domain
MPYEIFISYAHEDLSLLKELKAHLRILQWLKLISTWHDGDISPGMDWEQHIMTRLNSAQIILLLVSADFMNSDFCYSIEMEQAIQKHDADLARVIPIMLRPVYWNGAPFAKLQVLPTDAIPVTKWPTHDDAFEDVVRGIVNAIEDLQKKGKAL